MSRIVQLSIITAALTALVVVDTQRADAIEWRGRRARYGSYGSYGGTTIDWSGSPWHAGYAHPAWGAPVALVVPPTATTQSNYRWGVPSSRIDPITAQFSRDAVPVGISEAGGFQPAPQWPSDTNQMGVYYIRGPW
ncbi:MAG: hypothetical protein KDA63_16450 [Planctomycetales bacterium]|nr:hypothetical protein [Planctomycetales bacterium]